MSDIKYTLRNKEKLEAAFGEGWYKSAINDLNEYFDNPEEIEVFDEPDTRKKKFIMVPYTNSKGHFYIFVVLENKDDTYNLAYFETMI